MPLHVSSTCAHHQEVEVKIALHSLWYHHTYRCVMQFWPPDDEHMCSKHIEAWNKHIVKQILCIKFANYWDKYTEMHGQQNIKIYQSYVFQKKIIVYWHHSLIAYKNMSVAEQCLYTCRNCAIWKWYLNVKCLCKCPSRSVKLLLINVSHALGKLAHKKEMQMRCL